MEGNISEEQVRPFQLPRLIVQIVGEPGLMSPELNPDPAMSRIYYEHL